MTTHQAAPAPLPTSDASKLLRRLLDHSLGAALLIHPRGGVLAANPDACSMFGGSEALLKEHSHAVGLRALADADDPRLTPFMAACSEYGQARGALRMRRMDGQAFEAELSSIRLQDDDGFGAALLTLRDVSALRLAERAARESEQRLGFALDAAAIGDWDMDLRTNVARRSLRHDACFGYRDAVPEWGYDTFLAHVHPADRDRVHACYSAAMGGHGEYDVEFRAVWPDTSVHWLWSKGRFYFDEEGKPYRVAGIQVDITERRETAEALRRSEERLQLVLRSSNDAPWDLDLETGEPYYSPRWLQMLGYASAPPRLDAGFWERHLHPEDAARVMQTYAEALDGGTETFEIEMRFQHRNGHHVPVLSRGFVLRNAAGKAIRVSGTNTDLTEHHRVQEAERRRAAAEAANTAKTQFLASMSHELRTPLNAVIGFAQLLRTSRAEPLTPTQLSQVQHIEQAGWHQLDMVDEILDLSRIDSGHARLLQQSIDVGALLTECAGMMQSEAKKRSIGLAIRAGADAIALHGDRTRVKQIVLNFLSNAVKYTQVGGSVVLASQVHPEGEVAVSVTDTGPGLTDAQMGHLFEPFNRLGRESGRTPGTGIGLVICKRLADLMGGRILVDSKPGKGSMFALRLPAALATTENRATPVVAAPVVLSVEPTGPRHRVLYIEDNEPNAEVMRGFMEQRSSVTLDVRRSAREGLLAVQTTPPDLILLDLQLPDMHGLQVLELLQKNPITVDIPVIVVSASALSESVRAAKAAGALDYLPKPIRLEELLSAVDRALARRLTRSTTLQ